LDRFVRQKNRCRPSKEPVWLPSGVVRRPVLAMHLRESYGKLRADKAGSDVDMEAQGKKK
jgi:hypothetical protein